MSTLMFNCFNKNEHLVNQLYSPFICSTLLKSKACPSRVLELIPSSLLKYFIVEQTMSINNGVLPRSPYTARSVVLLSTPRSSMYL